MTVMKNTKLYGVARQNKPEIKRFGKFAVVGFSGLIVDVILLNILERNFGLAVPVAVAIAFVAAATNNFIWNRLWVYPETRNQQKRKQLPVFLAVNAIGLGISELIFAVAQMPISEIIRHVPIALVQKHYLGLGLNVTKAIAAIIVMMWNFVVNRAVTFRSVKWQTRADEPLESAL